ncbi:MAG: substrate-binding domain-containing protein [Geobacteraceae bacterium]|nr:substrate-binding domain-containing protein [Geobacteraceae bacterium]
MRKAFFSVFFSFILCTVLALQVQAKGFILMASTIGPIDAGIVSALEAQFEKDSGIRVRHVGAGTGAALKISQQGTVDLVMVHAKSLEEKFIADGYGTERIPVMYNDFVIVGPSTDPAGIKGMTSATDAMKKIAEKGVVFISRGDNSGTNVAELALWKQAGVTPAGPWYEVYEKGKDGNAATLAYTDQKGAYTFIDRATYLSVQKSIKLAILVEKDEALLNFISVIPVNPKKFPKAHYQDAMKFVQWLTSPEHGQKVIVDFGIDTYGSALFFPNSMEWQALQGKQ